MDNVGGNEDDKPSVIRSNKPGVMDDRLLLMSDQGNSILVRKMIKAKVVNVNCIDPLLKMTPLALACKGGHYEVAKLLLEAGADANIVNINKVTPLHFAAKNNDEELTKLLLINGANPDPRTREDLRPVDFTAYDSEVREIISDFEKGIVPEIEEYSEIPFIPDYAIEGGQKTKKKKGKKGGKKKGKKGGKKGGKKKGKKKK